MKELHRSSCSGYVGVDEQPGAYARLYPVLAKEHAPEAAVVEVRDDLLKCVCPYAQEVGREQVCAVAGISPKEIAAHPLIQKLVREERITREPLYAANCALLESVKRVLPSR